MASKWLLSKLVACPVTIQVLSAKAFGVVMVINYQLALKPFWYAMLIAKGRQYCLPRDNTGLYVVRAPV